MKASILALVLSTGFLLLSIRAMRRGVLRDQSAVLWLGVSVIMVIVSATLPLHLLDRVAGWVGIVYGSDLILLLAVLFLVVLVFHLSLSLTRLHQKHTSLVQAFGIMSATRAADEQEAPEGSSPRASEEI
jgi:hypothetical protein